MEHGAESRELGTGNWELGERVKERDGGMGRWGESKE
jgi:hypothetical protein